MTTYKKHMEFLVERLDRIVSRLTFAKPEEAAVTKDELDVLREARSTVDGLTRHPPHVVLVRDGERWSMYFRNGKRDLSTEVSYVHGLLDVDHPVMDHVEGRGYSRLVLQISNELAKELREVFEIPMQPAPIEATESLVRAAHSMSGAAIELTHVGQNMTDILKKLLEKL